MTAINPAVNDIVTINDPSVPAKNGKSGKIIRVPVAGQEITGANRFKVALDGGGEYVTRFARELKWPTPAAPASGGIKVGDRVTVNCAAVPAKNGKSGVVREIPTSPAGKFRVVLDGGESFVTNYATNLLLTAGAAPVVAPAPVQQAAPAPVAAPVRQAPVIDTTFAIGDNVRVVDPTVGDKNGEEGEVEETPAMREDRRYKVRLDDDRTYFTSKATDLILIGNEVTEEVEEEEEEETVADDTFSEGDRVRVTDLTVPAKNGRAGVVVGVPGDRDDLRYKVQLDNGETYWTGNPDDLKSSTAALAGVNAEKATKESKTGIASPVQEHTVMNVLKSTLDDNKANALLMARVEAGKLVILQISSRIKPLLPIYAQGYLEHKASGLIIANLISFSQKQWLPGNAKAAVLADCAMKAAMLEAGAALDIPNYINDAINGALSGFDFSKIMPAEAKVEG